MKGIKGFLGVSLIDWPDRISSIVYLGGCNFRCHFCYNTELVLAPEKLPDLNEEEILERLKERIGFIEGVVITGGEPTFYPELGALVEKINQIGLPVALETNGSSPNVLKRLTRANLLKAIFMDIKGPLARYPEITGSLIDTSLVAESAQFIKEQYPKIDAEFRMTVTPQLIKKSDIEAIGNWLGPDCKVPLRLQQFQNQQTLNPKFKNLTPYTIKELHLISKIAEKYFDNVKIIR